MGTFIGISVFYIEEKGVKKGVIDPSVTLTGDTFPFRDGKGADNT